jgi:hypothetical protein
MTAEANLAELRTDPAWRGVLHVFLTAFPETAAVWDLVDFDEHSIDFAKMLEKPWSGGERLLLKAAARELTSGRGAGRSAKRQLAKFSVRLLCW